VTTTIEGIEFVVDRRRDESEVSFSVERGLRASFTLSNSARPIQKLQFAAAIFLALEAVVGRDRATAIGEKLNAEMEADISAAHQ
jgi:hypothetical protein